MTNNHWGLLVLLLCSSMPTMADQSPKLKLGADYAHGTRLADIKAKLKCTGEPSGLQSCTPIDVTHEGELVLERLDFNNGQLERTTYTHPGGHGDELYGVTTGLENFTLLKAHQRQVQCTPWDASVAENVAFDMKDQESFTLINKEACRDNILPFTTSDLRVRIAYSGFFIIQYSYPALMTIDPTYGDELTIFGQYPYCDLKWTNAKSCFNDEFAAINDAVNSQYREAMKHARLIGLKQSLEDDQQAWAAQYNQECAMLSKPTSGPNKHFVQLKCKIKQSEQRFQYLNRVTQALAEQMKPLLLAPGYFHGSRLADIREQFANDPNNSSRPILYCEGGRSGRQSCVNMSIGDLIVAREGDPNPHLIRFDFYKEKLERVSFSEIDSNLLDHFTLLTTRQGQVQCVPQTKIKEQSAAATLINLNLVTLINNAACRNSILPYQAHDLRVRLFSTMVVKHSIAKGIPEFDTEYFTSEYSRPALMTIESHDSIIQVKRYPDDCDLTHESVEACIGRELEKNNTTLNTLYSKVMKHASTRGLSQPLEKAQRAWAERLDNSCLLLLGQSPNKSLTQLRCKIEKTQQRMLFLKRVTKKYYKE